MATVVKLGSLLLDGAYANPVRSIIHTRSLALAEKTASRGSLSTGG